MKTCAPSYHESAYASPTLVLRRSTGAARPCTACCYTHPVPFAAGHGPVQP